MDDREFYTFRGYQMLQQDKTALTVSMEDYLEMIYKSCMTDGYVRMNRLAEQLNVKISSATKIVQRLSTLGLVDHKRYGIIKLTEKGMEIGKFLLERHKIIEQFLKNIGVEDPDILLKDTETIEHNISTCTLSKLELLNDFFKDPDVKGRFFDHLTKREGQETVF